MCTIGDFCKARPCTSDRSKDRSRDEFDDSDWDLILIRSGAQPYEDSEATVCKNHVKEFLHLYKDHHPHCEDPQHTHPDFQRKGTVRVRYNTYMMLRAEFPALHPGKGLCIECYSKILKQSKTTLMRQVMEASTPTDTPVGSQGTDGSGGTSAASSQGGSLGCGSDLSFHLSPNIVEISQKLQSLNRFLASHKATIDEKQIRNVSYAQEKLAECIRLVRETIEKAAGHKIQLPNDDFEPMVDLLKAKFKSSKTSAERVKVLSLLPPSWTQRQIMEELELKSNHLISVSQKLVKEQGILPSMAPKKGHGLPESTLEKIQTFYDCDEESVYIFLGQGNCFSVHVKGSKEKEKMQKRLLLTNLNELHSRFVNKHPDIKVSLSKFASLRPKYCVFAEGPGTHIFCVCATHQNVKLMVDGAKLQALTKDDDHPIKSEHDCLSLIQCQPPQHDCIFGRCDNCPGLEPLQLILEVNFEMECIEDITFQRWQKKEKHWILDTLIKSKEEFTHQLVGSINELKIHDFLAKQQRAYLSWRKRHLTESEALVIMDFSENYSFLVQRAIQSFHWSNDQATVHPFVVYYIDKETKELKHLNFVIISDHLKHTVYAVHTFLTKFLAWLQEKISGLKKIIYFTDGCAAQYKSFKTTANLCYHLSDFGLEAEQHFFPTSHGKTENDGVGGIFKRTARIASLRGTLIRTPQELFDFASEKWPSDSPTRMHFGWVSTAEVDATIERLDMRFENAVAVQDIMQTHCIIPISETEIQTKLYSASSEVRVLKVRQVREIFNWDSLQVSQFLSIYHQNNWALGSVQEKTEENKTVSVKLMSPSGPAKEYQYVEPDQIVNVPINSVLGICRLKAKIRPI